MRRGSDSGLAHLEACNVASVTIIPGNLYHSSSSHLNYDNMDEQKSVVSQHQVLRMQPNS